MLRIMKDENVRQGRNGGTEGGGMVGGGGRDVGERERGRKRGRKGVGGREEGREEEGGRVVESRDDDGDRGTSESERAG